MLHLGTRGSQTTVMSGEYPHRVLAYDKLPRACTPKGSGCKLMALTSRRAPRRSEEVKPKPGDTCRAGGVISSTH